LSFESELKQGKFIVGQCIKCHKTSWPPSQYCGNCFGELKTRLVKEPGILLEWSAKDSKTFGIVEFEKSIRVIGAISANSEYKYGQAMRIVSCGFDGTPKFTFASI
jgi:uncharacterized protein